MQTFAASDRAPDVAQHAPRSASVAAYRPDAVDCLARDLGAGPFAQLCLFVSPGADLARICAQMAERYPQCAICGCSTAGEITSRGYDEGQIVAFGLPARGFEVETLVFEDLDHLDARQVISELLRARQSLTRRAAPAFVHECALLLVDGLSGQEDALVAALAGGLGAVPIVGGSAADGGRFERTELFARGRLLRSGAALMLVRSLGPVRPFSFDDLHPTARYMVVTGADPSLRLVTHLNDEPAAQEYARLLGVTPDRLSPFVFAENPVLVRAGGRHHVRAIQDIRSDGALVFFAAVAEGLVLTIAEPGDMAGHLEEALTGLARDVAPTAILGFDCLFRRIEATGRQRLRALSDILSRHAVTGFSTYGEQIGAMHVNQTLTGLAFYPPEEAPGLRPGGGA